MPEPRNNLFIEELLRMGECSYPNCIEAATHGGPHSRQMVKEETMSMSTKELLEALEGIRPKIESAYWPRWQEGLHEFDALIASLKAEPEPLAEEEATLVRDPVSGMHDICIEVVGGGKHPAYPLRLEGLIGLGDEMPIRVVVYPREVKP